VVKVKGSLNSLVREGFSTSELNFLNEVFMSNLGELTSLVSIKVNVVNIEGSSI
jgi:hypothetical protein